ncbi:hypothetical protein [Streptomyces sp. NPDC059247]|uniref:hypothetical protein n=1 Tax=Streptomyces sp. NPDC059247 TaxID=3346790 RepID=UPI0036826FE9
MTVLRNRRIRPQGPGRIARDLVATLAECGEPGADPAPPPGRAGAVATAVRGTVTERAAARPAPVSPARPRVPGHRPRARGRATAGRLRSAARPPQG